MLCYDKGIPNDLVPVVCVHIRVVPHFRVGRCTMEGIVSHLVPVMCAPVLKGVYHSSDVCTCIKGCVPFQ